MAHYVSIPKDLNDIKEKFMMGFTKRQVICFGIGLAVGAPVLSDKKHTLMPITVLLNLKNRTIFLINTAM